MRFFHDFPEALNELKRELAEMGIKIKTKSVQNLDITNNDGYRALELQNYQYTITSPNIDNIPLKDREWCLAELKERTTTNENPGSAWKLRYSYWKTFLKKDGTFDYAYPERMALRLDNVINALSKDPMTRRAFLPIFDRQIDLQDDFHARVPCSLGYWFFFRQGQLNVTYLQRSADFSEHFNNDIWLAYSLCLHIARELNMQPGFFSHWLGSLHVFAKDVEGVF